MQTRDEKKKWKQSTSTENIAREWATTEFVERFSISNETVFVFILRICAQQNVRQQYYYYMAGIPSFLWNHNWIAWILIIQNINYCAFRLGFDYVGEY